jgi:hypothetical protein
MGQVLRAVRDHVTSQPLQCASEAAAADVVVAFLSSHFIPRRMSLRVFFKSTSFGVTSVQRSIILLFLFCFVDEMCCVLQCEPSLSG